MLDTCRLAAMLGREFDSHYYLHTSLAAAIYADETVSIDASFPTLLDRCEYFLAGILEGNGAPAVIEDGFAPFVEGATRYKHQGFREETEIRIVAVPGRAYVAERVLKEYPDRFKPPPIKPVQTSQPANPKRFISSCIMILTLGSAAQALRSPAGTSAPEASVRNSDCEPRPASRSTLPRSLPPIDASAEKSNDRNGATGAALAASSE